MSLYESTMGVMNRGEMQDVLRKKVPKGKIKTIGDIAALKDRLTKAIMADDYEQADEIRSLLEEAQRR